MKRLFLTAALLALPPSPASAGTDSDAQAWFTASASGAIAGRLLGQAELITRFSNDADGLYEAEIGGFLGYRLTDRVSLWAGYVRVPRYARDARTVVEDRTRQQVTADLGAPFGGRLSGRVRLEQRFRSGGDIGWRLRPQLKFARALKKDGIALVASHESFLPLNDTDWGQRSRYERMRNFVGLQLPVAGTVAAEIGYLNQYNFRAGRDAVDHVLSTTFSHAF